MFKINDLIYSYLTESMKENYKKTIEILNNSQKTKEITSNEIAFVKRTNMLLFTIHFKKVLNEVIQISEDNKKKKSFLRFNNQKITSIIQLSKTKSLAEEMIKEGIMEYGIKAKQILSLCEEINKKIKELSKFEVKIIKNSDGELVAISKEKKTCPCCFRKIEVDSENKMVHHGYNRINGFQTKSCFGQGKVCFELSKIGTIEYIEFLENNINSNKIKIENLRESNEIKIKDPKTGKISVHLKGERFFDQVKEEVKNSLNFEMRENQHKTLLLKEKIKHTLSITK